MAKKKAGRPKGSKTDKAVVDSSPSKCPNCGSTKRTGLNNCRTIQGQGVDPVFGPYTAVRVAYANCRECGRRRLVRTPINDAQQ